MASSPLPCPFGKKEAWMPTGEDVRVRGQKRRMREEMTRTLNREFKALLQPVGCRQEGRGRRIAHSSMICTYGVVNKTSAARAWPHGAFTTRTTSERAPGEHKRKPKASAPMSHESALGHFSCKIHKYLRTITRHSFTVSGFGTRVHMPTERRTV